MLYGPSFDMPGAHSSTNPFAAAPPVSGSPATTTAADADAAAAADPGPDLSKPAVNVAVRPTLSPTPNPPEISPPPP